MTYKWTIRKYANTNGQWILYWPWYVFAPGITPPESISGTARIRANDMWVGHTHAAALAYVNHMIRESTP